MNINVNVTMGAEEYQEYLNWKNTREGIKKMEKDIDEAIDRMTNSLVDALENIEIPEEIKKYKRENNKLYVDGNCYTTRVIDNYILDKLEEVIDAVNEIREGL